MQYSVTFFRDIRAKLDISNSQQSPDIGQNADRGISDFWISGQFFTKENGHNSRASHDVDMEHGQITKRDKSSTVTSKN